MANNAEEILRILDRCCEHFSFPMLDNGYIYLAATRLSLYRSPEDWAMAVEVFGFSPRAGFPGTDIQTFASRLHDRDRPEKYINSTAYAMYLENNPHNEFRSIWAIEEGAWLDSEDGEFINPTASGVVLRGRNIALPSVEDLRRHGIEVEAAPRVQVFELCRFLADIAREDVLMTPEERRASVLPGMEQILQLEEWHHPNLAAGERISDSETFRQLARVLATGDVRLYQPTNAPNTHWRNWPEGGRL